MAKLQVIYLWLRQWKERTWKLLKRSNLCRMALSHWAVGWKLRQCSSETCHNSWAVASLTSHWLLLSELSKTSARLHALRSSYCSNNPVAHKFWPVLRKLCAMLKTQMQAMLRLAANASWQEPILSISKHYEILLASLTRLMALCSAVGLKFRKTASIFITKELQIRPEEQSTCSIWDTKHSKAHEGR